MDYCIRSPLKAGFAVRLVGWSALDRYCGLNELPYQFAATDADLGQLARVFEKLRYPGADLADAAVDREGLADAEIKEINSGEKSGASASLDDDRRSVCYFRCLEKTENPPFAFRVLSFSWDIDSTVYRDPYDMYPIIRRFRDGRTAAPPWFSDQDCPAKTPAFFAAAEAALIIARYKEAAGPDESYLGELTKLIAKLEDRSLLRVEAQRVLLDSLLLSRRTDLGFKLLLKSGFVVAHWPELAVLDQVPHSKDYHPEGNVWQHTMETFRHRKFLSLSLSLALLLHDTGKADAESGAGHRFDQHAELGVIIARRFLKRLGYDSVFTEQVLFLIRNHMLPAALPRLPLYRIENVLESPNFPLLLELYRCDESSSYKGLDGFFASCAAYRNYLKNVKNPYRSANGKLLLRKLGL